MAEDGAKGHVEMVGSCWDDGLEDVEVEDEDGCVEVLSAATEIVV